MAASSTTSTLHSVVGRSSLDRISRPRLLSHAVSTRTFRCRFWRLIAIVGALPDLHHAVGVFHPMVEDPREDADEAVGDEVQIAEREVALVELAVHEDAVDDLLHGALDAGQRRLG